MAWIGRATAVRGNHVTVASILMLYIALCGQERVMVADGNKEDSQGGCPLCKTKNRGLCLAWGTRAGARAVLHADGRFLHQLFDAVGSDHCWAFVLVHDCHPLPLLFS